MRPCLTKKRVTMRKNSLPIRAAKIAAILMAAGQSASPLAAQEAVQRLDEVVVRADYDREVDGVFLPDVEGTKIHAGKKTSNIDLEQNSGHQHGQLPAGDREDAGVDFGRG